MNILNHHGRDRMVVGFIQTLSHNVVLSKPRLSWIRTHNVSGDRHYR
jgi:hypothetical protein